VPRIIFDTGEGLVNPDCGVSVEVDNNSVSTTPSAASLGRSPIERIHGLELIDCDLFDDLDDAFADYGYISECSSVLDPAYDDDELSWTSCSSTDSSSSSSSGSSAHIHQLSALRIDDLCDLHYVPDDGLLPDDPSIPSCDPLQQLQRICMLSDQSACDIYHARLLADSTLALRCHCDGGATTSTTNQFEALWHCRRLTGRRPGLRVADNTVHRPTHVGYLKVPTLVGGYVFVRTYYTKEIPATILSPYQLMKQLRFRAISTYVTDDHVGCSLRICHPQLTSNDILFPCDIVDGLMYTDPVIMPSRTERTEPLPIIGYIRSIRAAAYASAPPSAASVTNTFTADSDPTLADLFLRYTRIGMQRDVDLGCLDSFTLDVALSETGEGTAPDVAPSEAGEGTHLAGVPSGDGEGLSSGDGEGTSSLPASASFAGESDSGSSVHSPVASNCSDASSHCVCRLTAQEELLLWHARFGHMGHQIYEKLVRNKLATGIPQRADIVHELDKCPICLKAKLHKAARSNEDSRKATECYQGISVDFGFIVQQSKNSERMQRLQGLNGETCYCLITDHHSGTIWGRCFSSKAAPMEFLDHWLRRYGLPRDHQGANGEGKYVRLDGGGELGNNHEVRTLFEKAGYSVEVTAPDSSHQNGPGERPHRTIGDAMRAMLSGAGLPAKFWPYAFQHFVRLYNLVPHGGRSQSPYQIATGKVPDLRFLRTFGCRVYTLVADPEHDGKLERETRDGIFLGYPQTHKNILYYDLLTSRVKTAQHVAFDETTVGMDAKTPNADMLHRLRSGVKLKNVFDAQVEIPDIDVSLSPFVSTESFVFDFHPDDEAPIGMSFTDCNKLGRAFIHDVTQSPHGRSLRAFRKHFEGSYVVSIDDDRVYNCSDVKDALDRLQHMKEPPDRITVVLAPERKSDRKARPPPLHMRSQDIRHVASLLAINPDNLTSAEFNSAVAAHDQAIARSIGDASASIRNDHQGAADECVFRLQTDGMTDEERALKNFHYRNLKKLKTWPEWKEAHAKQLNSHYDDGCLGAPIHKSQMQRKEGFPPSLMRIVWSNLVKVDGTRKTRACVDGSKRGAPWL